MAVKPLPSLYTDLYRMSQIYRDHSQRVEKELNSLLVRRDYLVFAGLYQLGFRAEELLELNFSDLKKEMQPSWHAWLNEYQTLLKKDSPWFHTARHESLRAGLSRRSAEKILLTQMEKHKLENWNILGLKHAHICKLIRQGLSDLQIQLNLRLSETFNLKPFHKHLESEQAQDQIYADIHSL